MTKGVTRPILEPNFMLKNNEIPLSSKKTRRNDKSSYPIADWGEIFVVTENKKTISIT